MADVRDPLEVDRERELDKTVGQCRDAIEKAGDTLCLALYLLERLELLEDGALFDGTDGVDALAELREAMRHLRNAKRIIVARAELEDA